MVRVGGFSFHCFHLILGYEEQLLRQPGNTPAPCYVSPPQTLPPAPPPATLGRNWCELLLVLGRGCMTKYILSVRPYNHHRKKFTVFFYVIYTLKSITLNCDSWHFSHNWRGLDVVKHMNVCTCVHFCPPPPKKEILNLIRFFMREKVVLRGSWTFKF